MHINRSLCYAHPTQTLHDAQVRASCLLQCQSLTFTWTCTHIYEHYHTCIFLYENTHMPHTCIHGKIALRGEQKAGGAGSLRPCMCRPDRAEVGELGQMVLSPC